MSRTEVARLRISPEHKEILRKNAEKAGMTMSEYMLKLILEDNERQNKN